jgi:hypothetical protein
MGMIEADDGLPENRMVLRDLHLGDDVSAFYFSISCNKQADLA